MSTVRESLAHNPLTVVSIFVNPAQFAPHEDLATYPRTIERDIQLLIQTKSESESEITNGKRLAIFVPPTKEMYPSGITQDVNQQRGTFIRVQGYEDEMEGKARPGFFRGVATVVMKLFNAVEVSTMFSYGYSNTGDILTHTSSQLRPISVRRIFNKLSSFDVSAATFYSPIHSPRNSILYPQVVTQQLV